MADGTYLPAALAGRCANGNERDQGSRIHAVPASDTLARNGYCTTKAACGATPGRRSAGWSLRQGEAVNCPRCVKRTAGAVAAHGLNTNPVVDQKPANLTDNAAGVTATDASSKEGSRMQCPVCHVEGGRHQRGCRNIPSGAQGLKANPVDAQSPANLNDNARGVLGELNPPEFGG